MVKDDVINRIAINVSGRYGINVQEVKNILVQELYNISFIEIKPDETQLVVGGTEDLLEAFIYYYILIRRILYYED